MTTSSPHPNSYLESSNSALIPRLPSFSQAGKVFTAILTWSSATIQLRRIYPKWLLQFSEGIGTLACNSCDDRPHRSVFDFPKMAKGREADTSIPPLIRRKLLTAHYVFCRVNNISRMATTQIISIRFTAF